MSARTWPENAQPTAEQFADWYVSLSREERIERAETLLDAMDRADACFLMNHEGRLQHLETAEAAVARVRALVPVVRFDEEPPRTEYLLRRGVLAALAGDDEAGLGSREAGNGHESDEWGTGGGRVHRDAERGSNANDVIRGDG